MFRDRLDAAHRLAERLIQYRGQNPLVLGIPRGAVAMAQHIAAQLQGEFDVVLVRKLGAPRQPELAVGSVDESGWAYIANNAALYGADSNYIEAEKQAQLLTLQQRRERYRSVRAPINPAGRIVIVVDDGLATGATMIAALQSLRSRGAAQLVCAVPVSAPDTLQEIAPMADLVVCLEAPQNFRSVGQFYAQFTQVTDEEVIAALRG